MTIHLGLVDYSNKTLRHISIFIYFFLNFSSSFYDSIRPVGVITRGNTVPKEKKKRREDDISIEFSFFLLGVWEY